jgi:hypothetical protein
MHIFIENMDLKIEKSNKENMDLKRKKNKFENNSKCLVTCFNIKWGLKLYIMFLFMYMWHLQGSNYTAQ